jgi:hypothetical protein
MGRGHSVPKWMAVPVRALLDITSRLSRKVKAREASTGFQLETWDLQVYCLYAMSLLHTVCGASSDEMCPCRRPSGQVTHFGSALLIE